MCPVAHAWRSQGASTHESQLCPHAEAQSSVFGASQDLLLGAGRGHVQAHRATPDGSQRSSQELGDRHVGSAVLLSPQALLLHRDHVGRALSLPAKRLLAVEQERREGRRSPRASRGVAATVAAPIHREGPLPADKQADMSQSETPAQGQHHKSRGGSKRASQPASHSLASVFPPGALSLCTRQPGDCT